MSVDRSYIRVKAMLIAPNADGTRHLVSRNAPSLENSQGYDRFVGGGVELGETHRDAVIREVDEELGAQIRDLVFVGVVENIFRLNGELGHEIVALYTGRLDPEPPAEGGTLTEIDGSVVPVVWRPFDDADETVPLYPAVVADGLRSGALRPSVPDVLARLIAEGLVTPAASVRAALPQPLVAEGTVSDLISEQRR